MVEQSLVSLDQVFQALANPTRRQILRLLALGEATVLEIAAQFDISLNGVSKHLKVLEKAGLIQRQIQGRTHTCSLQAQPLQEVSAWIDFYRPYWHERLDALEDFLVQQRAQKAAAGLMQAQTQDKVQDE